MSTPDPCPNGEKFTPVSLTTLNGQELTRLSDLEGRLSTLEASSTTEGSMPSNEEIAMAFSTSFSIVLLCFLVARGVGTVLNMIRAG